MRAVLFDLDNTLYPEIEFVKSGFRAVARHLSHRYGLDENKLCARMWDIMEGNGRGAVFNILLSEIGLYSEDRVRLLVYLYRSHRPALRLYDDVRPAITCLRDRGLLVGVVTDGLASVQRHKVAVLGLEELFDVIVCSDEIAKDCWKPSPTPFRVALEVLDVTPRDAAYVGDDPAKDFIGANALGMLTIQIKREMQQTFVTDVAPEGAARARHTVKSMDQVLGLIKSFGVCGDA